MINLDVRRDGRGTRYITPPTLAALLDVSRQYATRMCRERQIPCWREELPGGRLGQWRISAEWAENHLATGTTRRARARSDEATEATLETEPLVRSA